MWSLILCIHSNCTLHACDGYSCRVKCSEWRCVGASVRCWTNNDNKWTKTHEIKAELPHVFLKHKNEKTCMEKKTWKKGPTAARKGRERWRDGGGVETVGCEGAYKPNGTLMVNGGLRWHVPSHGIFYSLSVPCSCCCVFLHHHPHPNPPPLSGTPSVFSFLLFLWLAEVHCFSWRVLEGLKRRAAVLPCRTLHFIKYVLLIIEREGRRRLGRINWTFITYYSYVNVGENIANHDTFILTVAVLI